MSTANPLTQGELLTVADMCKLVPNTSSQTWKNYRAAGTGPAYTRVGRFVVYRRGDVDQWLADNREIAPGRPA